MITIALTNIGRQEEPTQEMVRLQIYVTNEEFLGVYDLLEVWKSESGASGPYARIAGEILPARIPEDASDPASPPVAGPNAVLVGKDLRLSVSDQDVTIVFTGSDPLTYLQAAIQVGVQGAGVGAYVTAEGLFVVQTTTSGRAGGRLQILGGEAAPLLGLPTGTDVVYGQDFSLALSENTNTYEYVDPWGSSAHYYKVRFINSNTGATSEFSQAYPGTERLGLEPQSLAVGRLTLVDAAGKTLINKDVRVHMEFSGQIIDGKVVAGGDLIRSTDETGSVEFTLPRGEKVSVSIPGTSLVRTITVPDQDLFNLLDPDIADQDIFKVVVPDIVYAERRSL